MVNGRERVGWAKDLFIKTREEGRTVEINNQVNTQDLRHMVHDVYVCQRTTPKTRTLVLQSFFASTKSLKDPSLQTIRLESQYPHPTPRLTFIHKTETVYIRFNLYYKTDVRLVCYTDKVSKSNV